MDNYIEKIKQILDKTRWSQSKFAEEIGVTFATVNRWLKGHTRPHPTQLRQIDRVFKNTIGIAAVAEKDLRKMIGKVEARRKQLPVIRGILQKDEVIDEFLLELTYNSDAIEGSTLSKKETEAIIFDKAAIKDKTLIEHLEAVNHASILKDIFSGKMNCPIDEQLIKTLHKNLMQGIREDAGEYAKHQRAIRGYDLILPHPDDIPEEMRLLIKKINSSRNHSIEHIAKMHADFEAIHPFGDGNGRVGRLIMIIQLLDCGFAPCIISVNDKAKYYECLEYAQKKS
ncbi:MAG: Fic family protein, partial [Candidatus Omnitrophota bacterium]